MKQKHYIRFVKNFLVVVGIVLIWRGLWHVLDAFDRMAFGGSHVFTAIVGIIIGLVILYRSEYELEELGKL